MKQPRGKIEVAREGEGLWSGREAQALAASWGHEGMRSGLGRGREAEACSLRAASCLCVVPEMRHGWGLENRS